MYTKFVSTTINSQNIANKIPNFNHNQVSNHYSQTHFSGYPHGPNAQCHPQQPKTQLGLCRCPEASRTPRHHLPGQALSWCWQGCQLQVNWWFHPCLMEATQHSFPPSIQINCFYLNWYFCSVLNLIKFDRTDTLKNDLINV